MNLYYLTTTSDDHLFIELIKNFMACNQNLMACLLGTVIHPWKEFTTILITHSFKINSSYIPT